MTNFRDIQADIIDIVARLNAAPDLSRAALINPLFALAELGYEIELEGRFEIEDRARFSKKQIAERVRLRKHLFGVAGRNFDPGNAAELSSILYSDLKLHENVGKRPDPTPLEPAIRLIETMAKPAKVRRITASQSAASSKRTGGSKKTIARPDPGLVSDVAVFDPLLELKGTHEIVDPLLDYRQIDAATPRFAPEELYHAVRSGKRKLANIVPRAVVTGAG